MKLLIDLGSTCLDYQDTNIRNLSCKRLRCDEIWSFFTTKEVGEGPGLGLTICHGIISQAGGSILVASQPGEGACVEVYLPVSEN
jgi:nitrogen fixation/metabolism regulation signal transduction histidine kinase